MITIAHAAIRLPTSLVPCGTSANPAQCNPCHLWLLADNVINFILWMSLPILVIALLYGGIIWLISVGNTANVQRGKTIIFNAIVGILIAFMGWLIVDSIIKTLAAGRPVAAWNTAPSCEMAIPTSTGGGGGLLSGNTNINQGTYIDGVDTAGNPVYYAEKLSPAKGGEGDALSQQLAAPASYNQQIDAQYGSLIDSIAAQNGVDPAFVRATIQAESSGNASATHLDQDGKSSYGLMQIRPDTARLLDPANRNLSDAQIAARLLDPTYNINIGTQYQAQLFQRYSNPTMVAAAYNGGPGANNPSRDCSSGTRWQCQWDNTAHTIPNTGYNVTRNYVTRVTTLATALKK